MRLLTRRRSEVEQPSQPRKLSQAARARAEWMSSETGIKKQERGRVRERERRREAERESEREWIGERKTGKK